MVLQEAHQIPLEKPVNTTDHPPETRVEWPAHRHMGVLNWLVSKALLPLLFRAATLSSSHTPESGRERGRKVLAAGPAPEQGGCDEGLRGWGRGLSVS